MCTKLTSHSCYHHQQQQQKCSRPNRIVSNILYVNPTRTIDKLVHIHNTKHLTTQEIHTHLHISNPKASNWHPAKYPISAKGQVNSSGIGVLTKVVVHKAGI